MELERHAPEVLVDVDGVVADFRGSLWETGRRVLHGRSCPNRLELASLLDGPATRETAYELLTHLVDQVMATGWCYGIRPIPDAVRYVLGWREAGARLVFVTAPLRGASLWQAERSAWLRDVLDAKDEDIVSAHDKAVVDGLTLIEDTEALARHWSTRRVPLGRSAAVLIAQSWNEDATYTPRYSWADADRYVRELISKELKK